MLVIPKVNALLLTRLTRCLAHEMCANVLQWVCTSPNLKVGE